MTIRAREFGIQIQLWSDEQQLYAVVSSTRGGKRYGAVQPTKSFSMERAREEYINKRIAAGSKAAAKKAVTTQPAEEENKMAEKKAAGKGAKGAAAAAAAKAKASKKKKEEPVTTPPEEKVEQVVEQQEEQAAVVEKSQAHKVLDALFATVLEEADIPDTSQFTEEQIKNELKENAGLLTPEDKPAILSLEEGEMIWDFLCGLRKELAGEKVAKQTKGSGKAKAESGKKGGGKGKSGKSGSPDAVTKRGFMESLIATGKMTKREIVDATQERFPESSRASSNSYISHATNQKYANTFACGKVVTVGEDGKLRFAE